MGNFINLTGQRFGKLIVLEFFGRVKNGNKGQKKSIWICKCDCGNIVKVSIGELKNGDTESCGCKRWTVDPIEASWKRFYKSYKIGAKNRNLDFNLSLEDFKIISTSNCYYCNDVPKERYFQRDKKMIESRKNKFKLIVNGIDRINNDKGYDLQNCVACCTDCNIMKNDMAGAVFVSKILKIYNKIIKGKI